MSEQTFFLWGRRSAEPVPSGFVPASARWWAQYSDQLHISPAAKAELGRTSLAIGALVPDPKKWQDSPSPFKGLVVGAVQSGKTASMIGLSAIAFDRGYRLTVVLSGLKDDLRTQTALRFNTQLLRQSDVVPDSGGARTLPKGLERDCEGFAPPYHLDCHQYSLLLVRLTETLALGQNAVVIAKKNTTSLNNMRGVLRSICSRFGGGFPILIVDDEADEASVDAAGMPIPEAISNLWRLGNEKPCIAYVGYTATSASNLLQAVDNDLFPSDFVFLLKYASNIDGPLTFAESNSDAWYSGGDCFYVAFGDEAGDDSNFLVSPSVTTTDLQSLPDRNESLKEAVRAFLVAGAFRLALQSKYSFSDTSLLPSPHSMLVQTSSSVSDHQIWSRAIAGFFGNREHEDRSSGWDPLLVGEDIALHRERWRHWYDSYSVSRERIHSDRPHPAAFKPVTLDMILDLIPVVAEHTRIRAVNSDPKSGSSLDFGLRTLPGGGLALPQDIFVVAVGGAKLSRGLTIEGLCTTYFTRWNPTPTEDTVLQLSRWFGYRGRHLEFCRLFTTEQISVDLRRMHENDVDLRFQLVRLMEKRLTPKDAAIVICSNPRAWPTAKLGRGDLKDLAFSPFTAFLRDVESDELGRLNEEFARYLVGEVKGRGGKTVRSASGRVRGLLSEGWEASEISVLLDRWAFSRHNPSEEGNPAREYCRVPDDTRPLSEAIPTEEDPYQIAAYLRQWNATAGGNQPFPPLFNVGIAFGEEHEGCEPFDFPLSNRTISTSQHLEGGWTGRSANYAGDAMFDSPPPNLIEAGTSLRRLGATGLLLMYVVHRSAVGKTRRGVAREFHTPAFGIAIPAGGPSFRRVVIRPGK